MLGKWLIVFRIFSAFLETSAQYHQTDYKIKLHIVEISDYNRSYMVNVKAGLSWFNRTTRVINGNGTLIKALGTDVKLNIQVLKMLSNEYRFFPITLTIKMCKEIPKNMFGAKDLLETYSNMPPYCPVDPGFYYMRNGILDFSNFPPYIPTGDYKLEAKMINGEDYVGQLDGYGIVEENKKQWWK